MVKIKLTYGGGGDIKTKTLEAIQETIIRGRTSHIPIIIDSNTVMALINEVLSVRKEKFKVDEFTMSSGLSSSIMYRTDSIEDIGEEDLDDEIELRSPEISASEKIPKLKKGRFKTKTSSKDYWLAGNKSRSWIAGLLVVFILALLLIFLL